MISNDIIFGKVTHSDFTISETELSARTGCPIKIDDLSDQIQAFNEKAVYRYAYARIPISVVNNICDFGFESVTSSSLSTVLKDCNEAIIFAVSAGVETDRLISKLYLQNSSDAFLIDCIGSAAIEGFADYLNCVISKGINCTKRFSPGYSDFPLSFQKPLLDRLNASATVGISLSEKLFMIPMKSITAVIGIK